MDPVLFEAYNRAMGNAMVKESVVVQRNHVEKAKEALAAQQELIKAWDAHVRAIKTLLEDYGTDPVIIAVATNPSARLEAQTQLGVLQKKLYAANRAYLEELWAWMEKLDPTLKPFLSELRGLVELAAEK
jgi:hypothetical protein